MPNLGVTGGLKNETDEMKQRVNDHITLYLKMWDPSSGYSIRVSFSKVRFELTNKSFMYGQVLSADFVEFSRTFELKEL